MKLRLHPILILIISLFSFSCIEEKNNKEINLSENQNFKVVDTLIENLTEKSVKVIRVIDGDTFEIENKIKIRIIGIDTPEKMDGNKLNKDAEMSKKDRALIKTLGKLSSKYTEDKLLEQNIILIGDENNSDMDRYGRLLRYVYLLDGTFFNLQIIKDGYAYAYTKYPFKYMDEFRQAQTKAKNDKKGLWGNIDFIDMEVK